MPLYSPKRGLRGSNTISAGKRWCESRTREASDPDAARRQGRLPEGAVVRAEARAADRRPRRGTSRRRRSRADGGPRSRRRRSARRFPSRARGSASGGSSKSRRRMVARYDVAAALEPRLRVLAILGVVAREAVGGRGVHRGRLRRGSGRARGGRAGRGRGECQRREHRHQDFTPRGRSIHVGTLTRGLIRGGLVPIMPA